MKKEKAFTRTELVVIVVLLLAALVLIPQCTHHVKETSFYPVRCMSNLYGIGRGVKMYQCEYQNLNPIVWPKEVQGQFGMGLYNQRGGTEITRWANPTFDDWTSQPTVGGCLYLLVRYEDVDPKMFVCPGAPDDEVMDFEAARKVAEKNGWEIEGWNDLRDFQSMANLSYSYNDPWASPMDSSASARLVLLADKSPAYDTQTGQRNEQADDGPVRNQDGDWDDDNGRNPRHGNSRNHGTRRQNVLFGDLHVHSRSEPTAGFKGDNIYTYWAGGMSSSEEQKKTGRWDQGHAVGYLDTYLGN